MHLSHSETLSSQPRTASKGSAPSIAARIVSLFRRAGGAVWRYLEDVGQTRANRQLRMLADRWSLSDPELARQMRSAADFDVISRPASTAGARRGAEVATGSPS